jgi:ribosomal protein L17
MAPLWLVREATNEGMAVTRARAKEYRRRAQECLDLARAMSLERDRAVLVDTAQNWLRLAEQQDAQKEIIQQQQVQPENKDKKEQ